MKRLSACVIGSVRFIKEYNVKKENRDLSTQRNCLSAFQKCPLREVSL
jgi:hypothetical protein